MIERAQRIAGRVDSGFNERTIQFLNEGVEKWARAVPWPTLRQVMEVACTGARDLYLPQHVLQVLWLADKTNKDPIAPVDNWDREDASSYLGDTSGRATWWRERGTSPIGAALNDPAQLTVRTTVTGEDFTAHVAGIVRDTTASGTAQYEYFAEESLSVTGSGPFTTTNFYVRPMTIGKSDLTEGPLLILNGSTLVGRIAPNHYRSEYIHVEMLQIPPAGTVLRIGYLERPNPLTISYQQPHPSINAEYLVWYAAGLIHKAMKENDSAAACLGQAEGILNARIYKERMHGDKDLQGRPDQEYWGSEATECWGGGD